MQLDATRIKQAAEACLVCKKAVLPFKANICLQLMFYLVCKISFAKDVLLGCKMCTMCIDDPLQGSCKAVWVEFAKDWHSC